MSQFPQVIVDEQANAGMGTPDAAEKQPAAGGYRVLAVIAFLVAVGGLFTGLLSVLSGIFKPTFVGTEFLPEALIGYLYSAWYKPVFTNFVPTLGDMFLSGSVTAIAEFACVVLITVSVVLSLVLMIVSFVSAKSAKNCAMVSAVLVFLSYAGFFILAYYVYALLNGKFGGGMIDVSVGLPAAVMLIALVVTAIARRKGLGLCNVILFLLVAGALFGLTYPGTQSVGVDIDYMHLLEGSVFVNLSALAVVIVLALNIVISAFRMSAKKAYVFDAVRYAVGLVAIVLLYCALMADRTFDVMFNSANLLPLIVTAATALVAFLLSLIIAIAQAGKARAIAARLERVHS